MAGVRTSTNARRCFPAPRPVARRGRSARCGPTSGSSTAITLPLWRLRMIHAVDGVREQVATGDAALGEQFGPLGRGALRGAGEHPLPRFVRRAWVDVGQFPHHRIVAPFAQTEHVEHVPQKMRRPIGPLQPLAIFGARRRVAEHRRRPQRRVGDAAGRRTLEGRRSRRWSAPGACSRASTDRGGSAPVRAARSTPLAPPIAPRRSCPTAAPRRPADRGAPCDPCRTCDPTPRARDRHASAHHRVSDDRRTRR